MALSASSSSPPVVSRPRSARNQVSGSTSSGVTSRPIRRPIAMRLAAAIADQIGMNAVMRSVSSNAAGCATLDVVPGRGEDARGRARPRRRTRRRPGRCARHRGHQPDAQRRRLDVHLRRVPRRGRRRHHRVADLRPGDRVEQRGRVAHRAGHRELHRERPGELVARRARPTCGRATASARRGRSTRRGSGSSRRRRSRARTGPCPPRPRRPSRPTTRRACGRGPTGCASGRRRAARWSA